MIKPATPSGSRIAMCLSESVVLYETLRLATARSRQKTESFSLPWECRRNGFADRFSIVHCLCQS